MNEPPETITIFDSDEEECSEFLNLQGVEAAGRASSSSTTISRGTPTPQTTTQNTGCECPMNEESTSVSDQPLATEKNPLPTCIITPSVDLISAINESSQSQSLQRELRKLQFENPGDAFVSKPVMPVKDKLRPRPQQNEAQKNQPRPSATSYKPHHDKQGRFITAAGEAVDMCDCLETGCGGCHRPCRRCGSRKCSFQCRNGRQTIVESIEFQAGAKRRTVNPFL